MKKIKKFLVGRNKKKQNEREELEKIKKMIDNLTIDELCELYDKTN